MGVLKLDKQFYTFDEYLAIESAVEEKCEYDNGQIIAMAGGSLNHSLISNNIGTALNNALDKAYRTCLVTNSEVKIYIEEINQGLYPDTMVICDEPEFYKESDSVITNPLLVIEVLSKSTKDYDKGAKFEKYRNLPSFREYVLVWQTIPKIQTWYKESNNLWRISSTFSMNATITLHSIECEISLADIYKKIKGLEINNTTNSY